MNERWNAQIVKIGGERKQTRRALSVINQNLVGAHRYSCIVNKRGLSEKFGATQIGTLHQHYPEENKKPKPAIENFTIWEEHDTTEAQPVPMCLEQPETFSNDKVAQIVRKFIFIFLF
ncbi:LOW QUALITY PROTEIN: cyclin-B2-2-like [Solanum verrucosum]|uniref:LOW QUALITY PROTEIN: cyclin-B2-2-like n=1 Tax=Solanum verrucosum TaxID=315347 RepID=UPI0020D084A4|nr:LOW QUALITY PROTEIN: cyclin-B2-2-like [Solanum verrucosum]